jgi:hypothetical protein
MRFFFDAVEGRFLAVLAPTALLAAAIGVVAAVAASEGRPPAATAPSEPAAASLSAPVRSIVPAVGGLGFNGRGFLGFVSLLLPEASPAGPLLGVLGLGVFGFAGFDADPLRYIGALIK